MHELSNTLLAPGTVLGNYRLERKLGEGGMGAVYLAQHQLIGRKAAVKVLLSKLSGKQEIINRFFNEARAASAVRHPGIVEIYDFGTARDGSAFIVMELLEGDPLSMRLRGGRRLPVQQAVHHTRQLASALGAAHALGIVHRDLKPDNIFLCPDREVVGGERAKVLDFGIAKLSEDGQAAMAMTGTGAILGTPMYMAPEQCRGAGRVDARADLYALGCILYHMTTGRPPFFGEGMGDVLAAHIHVPVADPRTLDPTIPADAAALMLRLLEKEPARRPQSAGEVYDLASACGGAPQRAQATPGVRAAKEPTLLAPTPTTLSSAAASISHHSVATRRRSRLVPAILVSAAAAGVALVALLATGGSSEPPPVAASAPLPVVEEPPGQAESTPSIDAGVANAAPARVVAPAPTAVGDVTIELSSNPPAAAVYLLSTNERVGTTPLKKRFPAQDAPFRFELRLDGYESRVVDMPGPHSSRKRVGLREATRAEPVKRKRRHKKRTRKTTPRDEAKADRQPPSEPEPPPKPEPPSYGIP